jgi:hypothetical protein
MEHGTGPLPDTSPLAAASDSVVAPGSGGHRAPVAIAPDLAQRRHGRRAVSPSGGVQAWRSDAFAGPAERSRSDSFVSAARRTSRPHGQRHRHDDLAHVRERKMANIRSTQWNRLAAVTDAPNDPADVADRAVLGALLDRHPLMANLQVLTSELPRRGRRAGRGSPSQQGARGRGRSSSSTGAGRCTTASASRRTSVRRRGSSTSSTGRSCSWSQASAWARCAYSTCSTASSTRSRRRFGRSAPPRRNPTSRDRRCAAIDLLSCGRPQLPPRPHRRNRVRVVGVGVPALDDHVADRSCTGRPSWVDTLPRSSPIASVLLHATGSIASIRPRAAQSPPATDTKPKGANFSAHALRPSDRLANPQRGGRDRGGLGAAPAPPKPRSAIDGAQIRVAGNARRGAVLPVPPTVSTPLVSAKAPND